MMLPSDFSQEFSSDSSMVPPSFGGSTEDRNTESFELPPVQEKPSRLKRVAKWLGTTLLVMVLFVVFTIVQLPQNRLRNSIEGLINRSLASRQIQFSTGKSELSFGLGVSYSMENVSLTHPDSPLPAKFKRVVISPSILGLLMNRLDVTAAIESQSGHAHVHVSLGGLLQMVNGTVSESPPPMVFRLHAEEFDLGSTQLIPFLIKTAIEFNVSGDAEFKGSTGTPESYEGSAQLKLTRIRVPEQTLMGFKVPSLAMSTGQIDLEIPSGSKKMTLKKVQLGKPGSSDDLSSLLDGSIQLGRRLNDSSIDSTLKLTVSEKLLQSIPLLQALLGMAKQPDGTYAYKLSGSLLTPFPVPLKQ